MNEVLGKPMDRVDGRLKVTGQARYAGDFSPSDTACAVTVQSTISKGSITTIDISRAATAPGVIVVITHKNAMRLNQPTASESSPVMLGEKNLLPLQGSEIFYNGQHIALVVAETFEQAESAARLIAVTYNAEKPLVEIEKGLSQSYQPKDSMGRPLQIKRGDFESAWASAPEKFESVYETPVYHHNPMEPHGTVAEWNGDDLTIYDSTQGVLGSRAAVAEMLGVPLKKVRLISPFVGGGFGCKGFTWAHTVLASMAAKKAGRPVKLVLDRQQMFTCNGHRARTIQQIGLGAATDGKLAAIRHATTTETSFVGEFVETAGLATNILYNCANADISHNLIKLNKGTPTPMRAPGEAPGTFALECAMDELAHQLKIDPVQLRIINHADVSPKDGKAWSSKHLKECYQQGMENIGWSQRAAEPGSVRKGDWLVGYGMSTATYPANRQPASAKVQIFPDGHAVAASCTQDIGTGTYTIMTQIASEELGIPVERIQFKLGDSNLPAGPVSGGSQTTASVGPVVRAVAILARRKAVQLAIADARSPLYRQAEENIAVENGRLFRKDSTGQGETYADILSRQQLPVVEAEAKVNVSTRENSKSKKKSSKEPKTDNPIEQDEDTDRSEYAFQSFGAQFMKVLVDPVLGRVRVAEAYLVMDIGNVMNLKTAKNQLMGGFVFGLGMALMEESVYDQNSGRIVTRDLANYLVPVHADMPEIEVRFIGKPDLYISPLGARGIGEIGITGAAAAVANAVFNATGKRIRQLPITPGKLI
jgi:xanthine dehydrogenase YagR molybdenum-binding subunit